MVRSITWADPSQPRSITWAHIWAQWGLPVYSFPPKSPGSQGRQNNPGDGGTLGSIPAETAAQRKRREHLGSLPLEGAGRPLWGSSIQPGSGLQSGRSLRIPWNRTQKGSKASRRPFLLTDRIARWDPHRSNQMARLRPEERLPYSALLLLWSCSTRSSLHIWRGSTAGQFSPWPRLPGLWWARPAQARTGGQFSHGHHGTES